MTGSSKILLEAIGCLYLQSLYMFASVLRVARFFEALEANRQEAMKAEEQRSA